MVDLEKSSMAVRSIPWTRDEFVKPKRDGLSDERIGRASGTSAARCPRRRKELGVTAVFNRVDTCAAEFESFTPYLYSSYEVESEAEPHDRKKVMILGSGPNRIGQGIEFDYCCCHASFALQDFGVESIMVNCNPETVSTDYDTSDRLYFEPLTLEEVMNIVRYREARRRHRAVRRSDAAQSRAAFETARRADHRDRSCEHRPRGRSQAFRQAAR